MIIDLDGALVAAEEARLDPRDRGFTLGDGILESFLVAGGEPVHLAEHLARLEEAARITGIPLPFDRSQAADRVRRVCAANDLAAAAGRIAVSRGVAARGVAAPADCSPTVVFSAHPLPPGRNDAVTAVIAQATRRNDRSPLSRIKPAAYLDSIIALKEAREKGADDAILLNTGDRVACAAYANLFAVIDGALVTPPLADGPMPGVTRAHVLAGLGAAERSLVPDDLARATEIFLTNSFGVRAVTALDGAPVGDGGPGPTADAARRFVED